MLVSGRVYIEYDVNFLEILQQTCDLLLRNHLLLQHQPYLAIITSQTVVKDSPFNLVGAS